MYSKNSDKQVFVSQENKDNEVKVTNNLNVNLNSLNNSLIIEERRITLNDGHQLYLKFISTADMLQDAKDLSLGFLPYSLSISLLLSAIVSLIYSKSIKNNIDEIKNVTDQMMQLDKNVSLVHNSDDEVGDLKKQINELYFTLLKSIDDLELKNKEILELEKLKYEFLKAASHELKTPITAIRGYSELLSQGFFNDENQKKMMLSKIQTEVTNMSSLINDILMLSRLDSDDLIVEKVPVKMQALMKDISEDYEGLLLKYNVELHTDVEPITYIGNGSQIETLISNLVSNAIKYNKEDGHVYVHIYSKKDNMIIEVKDTGIGIPLADQGRVFERFYRVDKGRSRIKGGTGLGLAIVKHIVSYNKGTVKLHSQLGEGTCITITLPNKS